MWAPKSILGTPDPPNWFWGPHNQFLGRPKRILGTPKSIWGTQKSIWGSQNWFFGVIKNKLNIESSWSGFLMPLRTFFWWQKEAMLASKRRPRRSIFCKPSTCKKHIKTNAVLMILGIRGAKLAWTIEEKLQTNETIGKLIYWIFISANSSLYFENLVIDIDLKLLIFR